MFQYSVVGSSIEIKGNKITGSLKNSNEDSAHFVFEISYYEGGIFRFTMDEGQKPDVLRFRCSEFAGVEEHQLKPLDLEPLTRVTNNMIEIRETYTLPEEHRLYYPEVFDTAEK